MLPVEEVESLRSLEKVDSNVGEVGLATLVHPLEHPPQFLPRWCSPKTAPSVGRVINRFHLWGGDKEKVCKGRRKIKKLYC